MTDDTKIVLGFGVYVAACVGVPAAYYLHVTRAERKKRKALKFKENKDIAIVRECAALIQERIHAGYYDHNFNLDLMMNDFKFECIIRAQSWM